jgi:hypothetical protein
MSSSRPRLTPALQQTIVAYVRGGGFPHVAAEAAGVPAEVFDDWMRQGERPGGARRYRAFALAVRQAAAQARLAAEVEAREKKALDWLRCGPGRETVGRPGWTATVKPRAAAAAAPLLDPATQALVANLLDSLCPFPEARVTAAGRLNDAFPDLASTCSHRRPSQA